MYMLHANRGFASSVDFVVQSVDPRFAQKSSDRAHKPWTVHSTTQLTSDVHIQSAKSAVITHNQAASAHARTVYLAFAQLGYAVSAHGHAVIPVQHNDRYLAFDSCYL